ncbi:uncharacterized protein LOC144180556 isoform X1 [Haemaphysalis longicornis]
MAHLKIPDFDESKDKWEPYLIKVEAYFEANAVENSAKKRALLVAALSTHTVQTLAGKVAPRTPNSLTYEEAVATLNEYYDPKKNEISESYKFFNRCQAEGEPMHAFLVEIRRIANYCNFGGALDRMLRDRIVCGVRSSALQKQLLSKKDLTLEETEAIAMTAEAAETDVKNMNAEDTPLLKVDASRKMYPEGERKTSQVESCGRCGSGKHDDDGCPWARSRCYQCKRKGHLARKCRSRAQHANDSRAVRTNTLTVTEGSSNEEMETAHIWTRKNVLEPPIRRVFTWGGIELPMEVDTGSPICVISRELYEKHRRQCPSLRASNIKLSCYVGRLPVLGELQLRVRYEGVSVDCLLTVLDCAGPSLCGRDLLRLLDNAGAPILQVAARDVSPEDPESSYRINSIFEDYQDVFSADLGLIEGTPASLHLKESAIPKFWREFTLVTDHQPLLGLLRPDRQTPTMAATQVQRWALYLGAYQYKLQCTPGRQMFNSDALSRLPRRVPEPVPDDEPAEYVLSLETLDEGGVTTRELKVLTATDPVLSEVKRYTLNGWPKTKDSLHHLVLPYFDRKLELSVAHELLYWENRVVVPEEVRTRVLRLLHDTHQRSSAMKAVARSLFWWPGLDRDIEKISASCQTCIQNLPMPTAAPPVSWSATNERWSRVHVDFAGPIAGKMILVVVDTHTKWVEAIPLVHGNSETTVNCLRTILAGWCPTNLSF